MPTFVSTIQFTTKGFSDIKQTRQRAESFKSNAEKLNISVSDLLWTQGAQDGVLIFDAPDDETAAAAVMSLASDGYVRPNTSRAFRDAEVQGILDKLP